MLKKRIFSVMVALAMVMSMAMNLVTVSAEATNVVTWEEFKTLSNWTFGNYWKHENHVVDTENDCITLIKSSSAASDSSNGSYTIPQDKQGDVVIYEYEMYIPSVLSDGETANHFNQYDELYRVVLTDGASTTQKLYAFNHLSSTSSKMNWEGSAQSATSVSGLYDKWLRVTTTSDFVNNKTTVSVYDIAADNVVGGAYWNHTTGMSKIKNVYFATKLKEFKLRNMSVVTDPGADVVSANIEDGAENVDAGAIVLTFDDNVIQSVLESALSVTDAEGTAQTVDVTVNGNKAQIGIVGAADNTEYTLTIQKGKASVSREYTLSFKTGSKNVAKTWSTIGANASRFSAMQNWGGTIADNSDNSVLMSGKERWKYAVETQASNGILVVDYEFYIPGTKLDGTTHSITHYNMGDRMVFDTGHLEQFYGGKSKNTWHTVKYVFNFPNNSYTYTLDGTSSSGSLNGATYLNYMRFERGDGTETYVRNINAYYVDYTWKNSWGGSKSNIAEDIDSTTITQTNEGTQADDVKDSNKDVYTYSLSNAITDELIKLSFDFKANAAAAGSSAQEIRLYKGADLNSGGTPIAISSPYKAPQLNKYEGGFKLDLPEGVTALAADTWHTMELVMDVSSTNGTTVKKAVIDGTPTVGEYTLSALTSIGSMELWFYGDSNVDGNFEVELKNINFDTTYTMEEAAKEIKITQATKVVGETTVTVTAEISNTTGEVLNGKLIAAAYNGDNTLLSVGFADIIDETRSGFSKDVQFDKPSAESYTVKVFVWDGLDDLTPLCDAADAQ